MFTNVISHVKLIVESPSPNVVDGSAAGVGILSWLKLAPEIAGAVTAVWLLLRIYIALRDEVFGRKKDGNK